MKNNRDNNNQRARPVESLTESEELMRYIVRHDPNAIAIFDAHLHYMAVSERYLADYQIKESAIIGKHHYEVFPEMPQSWKEVHQRCLAGAIESSEDDSFERPDGSITYNRWECRPWRRTDGQIGGIILYSEVITDRKKAEKALQESEIKYRTLFENMLNGFAYCQMIFDKEENPQDFVYLAVNKSFERLTGLQDVVGKMISEVIPGFRESDLGLFEMYGRVALTGQPEIVETYLEALKMWLSIAVYSPQKEYFVAVFDVITDRKNAEEVLRQSEAKFRKLINSLPDPVLVVDTQGKIVYCNQVAMKTFGYTIDQLLGCQIETLMPQQYRDHHVALRNKYLLEPSSQCIGVFAQRKNGSYFPTEIMLEPVEINNKPFTLAIVRDITQRKLAELAVIKSENEFRLLAESMPQIVWITRPDGWNIYFNQLWVDYTGQTLEESYGHGWNKPFHPDDQLGAWEAWQNATKNSATYALECRLRRFDGAYKWWLIRGIPVMDADGVVTKWFGTCTDIDELKNSAEQLKVAKEQAEESDRLKSAFLANMSHEVRTPLNSIIGFSELLGDPDFEEEQKKVFIERIVNNGNHLLTIISDIMDISKIESGEIILRKTPVNIPNLMVALRDQFSFQAEAKNLGLQLILPDTDEESLLVTDADRLKQVFSNLIGNALKFTANGQIAIGFHPNGQLIEFFVRDTGLGIFEENHDKIFERFRQVEDAHTRTFGGNGLGLAISKKLVELMGGNIRVTSEPGKGSTFYFTIPKGEEEKVGR